MGKYFSISELCQSETAERKGIDNTPDYFVQGNLELLIRDLDSLREAYGKPIRVTSGYRSEVLNRAVGGSKTSSHMSGLAADLQPVDGDFKTFCQVAKEWAEGRDYDQMIIERNSRGARWLHYSPLNSRGERRRQSFKMEVV